MDLLQIANQNKDALIEMRRHLHLNPEVSGKEFETLEYIKEKLTEYKVDYIEIKHGGILAWVGDETKGKTVLLRADCDALPMQENPCNLKGEKIVVSKVDGVCHACGHDAHTSMLIGTAKILKEMEDQLNGKVYLVFERGEEGTGNIRYIIRYFYENNLNFDAVYGTHVLSTFDTGKISVEPGGVMAGAALFTMKYTGRGGHGSRPDLSVNPMDCFNAFYTGFQSLRMRFASPYNSLTSAMGKVQAGAVANIIPEELEFSGTVRFFDMNDGDKFKEELLELFYKTGEIYDCKAEVLQYFTPGPSVTNNAQLSQHAKAAITKHLGEEYIGREEPWMASESFAQYSTLWPAAFAFLGMKNPEKGVGAEHHNERFDVDEDVLPLGVAAAAAYAIEFLNNDVQVEFTPYQGTPMDLLAKFDLTEFED